MRKTTVAVITTSPMAMRFFLQEQMKYIASRGFDVHGIASPGKDLDRVGLQTGLPVHDVPMRRQISPVADLVSLWRLWNLIRRLKPEIVHTHTPKAGLLGITAAYLAGVPVRVYTINGLVLESRSGWRRISSFTDRVACSLSTQVLCVSRSVREKVIGAHYCSANRIKTLGRGGSHGVDLARFSCAALPAGAKRRFRRLNSIPEDALVLGFIGRVVRDKGIVELTHAWHKIWEVVPSVFLLLCGAPEDHDPLPEGVLAGLRADSRVRFVKSEPDDMPGVYAAIDVAVLPTYREGLPNVALECGAMGVPIVATRVTGCIDAVLDGISGLLVEPKNPDELASAVCTLLTHPEQREAFGAAAHAFVVANFDESYVSGLLLREYGRLLKACGRNDSNREADNCVVKAGN